MDLRDLGRRAKDAAYRLARASTDQKNAALLAMADAIDANSAAILAENCLDLEDGQGGSVAGRLLASVHLNGPNRRLPAFFDNRYSPVM